MKSYQYLPQPMLTVNWTSPKYCNQGVYIIYAEDNRNPLIKALNPLRNNIIRVGQGIISERLEEHSSNLKITRYQNPYSKYYIGKLYVVCANVLFRYRDGVERFLANSLQPLEGDRFPNCTPIAVNLPIGRGDI